MRPDNPKVLHYRRSRFVTQLPVDYLYSPSHYWIARQDSSGWKIGLTKFATRMLGEMVDYGFEVEAGAGLETGQVIGWVEGFKAIADIFCVVQGCFQGANPALNEKITLINQDPYGAGWLYLATGQPDSRCVNVQTYKGILDKTIDKILERQKGEEIQ